MSNPKKRVARTRAAASGQLSFYVETLDRDVKKVREHPALGVLLCATKNDEVVEYALAETTLPTIVAEHHAFLAPQAILRARLHELYTLLAPNHGAATREGMRMDADPVATKGRHNG